MAVNYLGNMKMLLRVGADVSLINRLDGWTRLAPHHTTQSHTCVGLYIQHKGQGGQRGQQHPPHERQAVERIETAAVACHLHYPRQPQCGRACMCVRTCVRGWLPAWLSAWRGSSDDGLTFFLPICRAHDAANESFAWHCRHLREDCELAARGPSPLLVPICMYA